MNNWTPAALEKLQKDGKIRGYLIHDKKKGKDASKKGIPTVSKPSKEKDWLNLNLHYWGIENKLELKKEYMFHSVRLWKFDWCFPGIMVAIEYEGIFSKKSRHTTISGFTGDIEKYNSAQELGWRIIRLTAKDYKNVIKQLNHYASIKNVHQ